MRTQVSALRLWCASKVKDMASGGFVTFASTRNKVLYLKLTSKDEPVMTDLY